MGPDYEMSVAAMLYGIRAVTTKGAQFTFVPADFLEARKLAELRPPRARLMQSTPGISIAHKASP